MKTPIAIIVALALLLASISIPSYVYGQDNINIAHGGDEVAVKPEEYVLTTTISIDGQYMFIAEDVEHVRNYIILRNVRHPEQMKLLIVPVFHVASVQQK